MSEVNNTAINFKEIFENLPGINILIAAEQKDYMIVAVSQGLLDTQPNNITKENLIGSPFFTSFPKNISETNQLQLRNSLDKVIRTKQPDIIKELRYDVTDNDGNFAERWWNAINKPIFNSNNEVEFILQSSVEITDSKTSENIGAKIKEFDKTHQLFMHAPVAVCIVSGKDYRVDLINEGMLGLLGRTKDVINKPIIESLPEAGLQGLISILDDVRLTGEARHISNFAATLLINDIRESLYLDLVFQPYQNVKNENELSIFCLAHNVTEQLRDRQKIKEITERLNYRNAIFEAQNEATPDAVNVVDTDGNMILFNNKFAKIWRIPEEVIKSKDDAAALNHAMQQLKDPEGFIKRVQYLYSTDKETSYDEIYFNDGRIIERNGAPIIGVDGIKYGWAWYFRDITEPKNAAQILLKSEARARLAAEAARLGTFDIDVQLQTIIYSPRVLEIFGYAPESKITYAQLQDAVHPEDRIIRNKAHETALITGELFYEVRIILQNAQINWIRLNGKYNFAGSQPTSFVGTVLDITEEKKAAELMEYKITERTQELQQANEQLKQFTYAASHDLQEPLRKISFFLDRLLTDIGPSISEDNKIFVDRILKTTARMRKLIDDLLLYSNSSFGKLLSVETNLNELIKNEVLSDMEGTIIETGAYIILEELPVVNGDQRQLRQLFQNIIGNAIKYRKNNVAPQISITADTVTRSSIDPNTHANNKKDIFYKIRIEDNGIGFEQEYAERIFKLFQRLHTKTEYEGTGIGLALVQKVLDNHNGFVNAVSKPGTGSIFNVYLPADN